MSRILSIVASALLLSGVAWAQDMDFAPEELDEDEGEMTFEVEDGEGEAEGEGEMTFEDGMIACSASGSV